MSAEDAEYIFNAYFTLFVVVASVAAVGFVVMLIKR